jgi:CubicO group peptidase (beta-lactamase class C family)
MNPMQTEEEHVRNSGGSGGPGETAQAQMDSVRRAYEGSLMPDELVTMFRDPTPAFATRTVKRGNNVRPLPDGRELNTDFTFRSNGAEFDFVDYVSRNRVAGLLVLDDGKIALELFQLANDSRTHWLSMSLAKSISSTLVGAAVRDGHIASIEAPITQYLPELAGSGYDGVSIRHILQMTSGVRWDDTHTEARSERREMLELQFTQRAGEITRYLARLPRIAQPGTRWNYSTGETHLVGALLRAATGRWVSEYLSETIWSTYGMESDATWWLESPGGLEVAGSGFGATLRDYGRFGLFMMNDGIIDGRRVLPEGWTAEAGAPREAAGRQVDYGFMWWPVAGPDGRFIDGAYSARGIFGQYIYINPGKRVVIVVWSARSKPKGAEVIADNDFFNAVVNGIRS